MDHAHSEVGRLCFRASVVVCASLAIGCNSNATEATGVFSAVVVVTASADTVTMAVPHSLSYQDVIVATNDRFSLFPDSQLTRDDGKLTLATNVGVADILLQPKSLAGIIVAASTVRLQPHAEARGDVTASAIDLQPGARIDGAQHTGVTLTPFEQASFIVRYTGGNVAAVRVRSHQSYSASPGRFAALVVEPNATLTLTAGDYFVDDFELSPNSTLAIATDNSVRIFARIVGSWDGTTTFQSQGAELLLVQTSQGQLKIGAPFKGTFVGTGVDVSLAKGDHYGAIFAKSVELDSQAVLHYQPPNVLAHLVAGSNLRKCAALIRPPVGPTGLATDRAYQNTIAQECATPGESSCSIKLASWAKVDSKLAADALVAGTFTRAQYLAVVRDRKRKRNAAMANPSLAQAICAGPDSDNDGVPDALDQCAQTPELTATLDNGCPNPTLPPARSTAGAKQVFNNIRPFAAEPASTLPDGSNTGPVATYDSSRMQPNAVGDGRCSGEIAGWEMANSSDGEFGARRLEGEVVIGHPPHGDFFVNHHTEDFNFFIVPDDHNPLASDPNADYSYLLAEGNFQTGEPKEHGRIEIENEYGALPWNDAADSGYYGIPTWVWPATGDRAIVEGYWIYDCGHHDPGYRSEIHPAWMVVALRNMMQSSIARGSNREGGVVPLHSDDASFSPVTKADVWISSFGGEAVEDSLDEFGPNGEDWWQPVNSRDYDFNIPAPVKPAGLPAGAQPVIQIQDPPGDYWRPPGAVGPSFDQSNLSTFERNGRTFVHVHVPFSSVATTTYLLFAKTIIVGWDVPAPDTVHLRITVNRWNVFDDLENTPLQAQYSPWFNSGDQSTFVRISDGEDGDEATTFDCDSDLNYMPFCEPDNGENSYVDNVSVDRFINGHDPLIVQFRAKEGEGLLENDEAGFASQAFTAKDDWGVGTHFLRQNDMTFAGEYDDDNGGQCDDEPGGSCYEVTYTISRITDPTTTTIGVPTVQYAQDPNHFTATVVTPGNPDKPRRLLPVTFTFSDGTSTQVLDGTTDDSGVAAPTDLLTLPAGTYTLTVEFAGNGLLTASSTNQSVVIERDYTAASLEIPDDELRWGHQDPMTVTLMEPNVGQGEPPLPIPGKNMTVTLTGPLGNQTFLAGPTGANGKATITPLMTLPPGAYQATACFAQDPWFRASCSAAQTVKVTGGFAGFSRGGPFTVSGIGNTTRGDVHVEDGIVISGTSHVLSAAVGERLEYVTTFTDKSNGSSYNKYKVPALGITPQYLRSTYCSGASSLMGVPITYSNKDLTFKNDQTVSGIYCVTGDIKIQSRVTGTAVLLATGKISTSGGDQHLSTADPTGANLLMLAGSADASAISLQQKNASFAGAIDAAGGVVIGSMGSTYTGSLVGQSATLGGASNTVDGR